MHGLIGVDDCARYTWLFLLRSNYWRDVCRSDMFVHYDGLLVNGTVIVSEEESP
jgi:hypothetical protein